jgi:NAD-dependent deacetylase
MSPAQPTTAPREAELLAEALARASRIVAFTGAGISTESGIPDFRSPGSPWLTNAPIGFDLFVSSEAARREAWRRKFAMDDNTRGAQPGRGHHALARLVAQGRSSGIITQNIDGLHQRAGLDDAQVVELHGNGTYAACLACGTRYELDYVRARFEDTGRAPRCERCEGIIKSATISFGQAMPETAMQRAAEWTIACDLFLVVGSSLQVYPAAGFPQLAKRSGARLVIVNRDPTPLDDVADLVLRGEIGTILGPIAAAH